ncbi:hypothetical protein [Paraglaciecola sp. 2405UD69-4]|uniref:hypothetical protein n=1 Tax=Paraglaciecola sp. 2405UD69-4 TaxID=3391836 RepID=UPI0039C9D8E6
MKNLVLTVGLLLTSAVLADELPKADPELIAELKEYCVELATEDGIDKKELKKFILECINEELDAEGYQALAKVE